MSVRILMPTLSPTMTEGHLVRWKKDLGDLVKCGDVLLEIETDKAVMEMEAVDDGTLVHIFVPGGTNGVPVGSVLAILKEKNDTEEDIAREIAGVSTSEEEIKENVPPAASESLSTSPSQQTKTPYEEETKPLPGDFTTRRRISPLAKRLAEIHHISVEHLSGSGPSGRIIKRDIEAFRASGQKAFPSSIQDSSEGAQRIPLTPMRKTIAQRLMHSKGTIPHFYIAVECLMTELLNTRQSLNNVHNSKLFSINDFLVRACAIALRDVPEMNSVWGEDHIVRYDDVDVAVAVSVEGGLFTPVVRRAAQISFVEMVSQLKDLIHRARNQSLRPQEFQGGALTFSNLGMFGIEDVQAIINPPHAGILAVGASIEKPVALHGHLSVAPVMRACLSADHRLVDGAVASRFLMTFKKYVECPLLMLCA